MAPPWHRSAAGYLLLIGLSSCGSFRDANRTTVIADSAGIAIALSDPSHEMLAEWRLAPLPKIEIGRSSSDPEYQLFQVRSARQLRDGGIVLANNGTAEIRFYDAAGTFVGATGRRGYGPGEFQQVGWVGAYADSNFVFDAMLSRFTVIDPEGRFARTFSLDQAGGSSLVWPVAFLSDNSLVVATAAAMTGLTGAGVVRDSAVYLRMGLDGGILDTIGRFPIGERLLFTVGEVITVLSRPFGPSGHGAVVAGEIYHGFADEFEVGVYSVAGELRRVIRLSHDMVNVTRSDIDDYRSERPRWSHLLDLSIYPAKMPAFSRLLATADEKLWIEEYPVAGAEQRRWWVFEPDGSLVSTIRMPPRFRLLQVGRDVVIGVWRDDLDVERVQVYDLIR
jgi:hypothetical protein